MYLNLGRFLNMEPVINLLYFYLSSHSNPFLSLPSSSSCPLPLSSSPPPLHLPLPHSQSLPLPIVPPTLSLPICLLISTSHSPTSLLLFCLFIHHIPLHLLSSSLLPLSLTFPLSLFHAILPFLTLCLPLNSLLPPPTHTSYLFIVQSPSPSLSPFFSFPDQNVSLTFQEDQHYSEYFQTQLHFLHPPIYTPLPFLSLPPNPSFPPSEVFWLDFKCLLMPRLA